MQKINLIHLSDLHYLSGKDENHELVLRAFFSDLECKIKKEYKNYIVFSGDIAQAGDSQSDYENFISLFDKRLNNLGITREQRICVPGNHDVSRSSINQAAIVHEGIVCQKLQETAFNDFLLTQNNILITKFDNYIEFEKKFAAFGVYSADPDYLSVIGRGWKISDGVGVFCLNSALCSSGGLKNAEGIYLSDKRRLGIATRQLQQWLAETKTQMNVFVMHHPLDFLTEWAESELVKLIRKSFRLCLTGHEHTQSVHHNIEYGQNLVKCSAPALFSKKSDQLGYASIVINESQVEAIHYRQWTRQYNFVSGVDFSNNDTGTIVISTSNMNVVNLPDESLINKDELVAHKLESKFKDSLISYSSQPITWVLPTLSFTAEIDDDSKKAETFSASDWPGELESSRIIARHEFGLTSLALYLVKEAWVRRKEVWLYLDIKNIKPNELDNSVDKYLSDLVKREVDVRCVVVDSYNPNEKSSHKVLEKIIARFKSLPVLCMEVQTENKVISTENPANPAIAFKKIYLWALNRSQVRDLVNQYNEIKFIGDEDAVTEKLISDLNALNLFRTPLNCLTLLKVSEYTFDENPVNRSELIKRVLFLLFNVDEIPNYLAKPDLKDCEFVLGYFIESMLKDGTFYFSRDHFLGVLRKCCSEKYIDLEVNIVFDVLYRNNLIINVGNLYCFRFTYWISYFAAQRMHHEPSFADFIFQHLSYENWPEIIEFYTGIDRRREDALRVLLTDLRNCQTKLIEKIGFRPNFDPYKHAFWTPTPETLEMMQNEISDGVQESNLPAAIKDHYADSAYDRSRPYYQEVRSIIEEQTFVYTMQAVRAASKALRNSDYADISLKKELLKEIMNCWELITKTGVILIPILAEHGRADVDGGGGYLLVGEFSDSFEKKVEQILLALPTSIVNWGKEDLFSQKMGPLLIDHAENETNSLKKHELMVLLVLQRPNKWMPAVRKYITSIDGNSFFLYNIAQELRSQYKYGFCSSSTMKEIESLIQLSSKQHKSISEKRNKDTRPVKLASRMLSSLMSTLNKEDKP